MAGRAESVGDGPRSVFISDLDGAHDRAVANYFTDNVQLVFNDGDGTFDDGGSPRGVKRLDYHLFDGYGKITVEKMQGATTEVVVTPCFLWYAHRDLNPEPTD